MTPKERKQAFKAYLEEVYRPFLVNADNVFKTNTSISTTLSSIHPEYGSVFDLDDTILMSELKRAIENPSGGSLAFVRRVKNLDWKQAFLKHYSIFLEIQIQNAHAQAKIDEQKEDEYLEGQLKETTFFKRKRSRALREECIHRYGCRCFVCGFDFEKVYGERGKNYIEVHHLNPMANYDDEHSITADDLRPLCSNCHSMIHRDPNGGVTEINAFRTEYAQRNSGRRQ